MPKVKLSEYSTTNTDNSDIEGINIAEGCAPSGINNAIRELMVHLKEFQTGSSGDPLTVAGTFVASGGSVITPRVVQISDATSITMNADTTDIAYQTNTQSAGTLTLNAPTGTPIHGQKLLLRLQSTNQQTFSWNAIFQGSSDIGLPTVSTGSSKYDYLGFIYNSTASKWQMVAKNFGF